MHHASLDSMVGEKDLIMGIKFKVTLITDSSNMGLFNRLLEDGTIDRMNTSRFEERNQTKMTDPPRDFVKSVREEHSMRNRREDGRRAVDCVVEILQKRPNEKWSHDEVIDYLVADYDYAPTTAHPALSHLERNGYITRPTSGFVQLTEKGRSHQKDGQLPFVTSN